MSTANDGIKLLHTWDVTVEREVEETGPETVNGQTVTVTRKVKKPVITRMALKQPTRRELRAAELFYGKEFNRFVQMGFLPRSIMVNKHLDLSGGILSEKERGHVEKLTRKYVELESDLARLATADSASEEKKKLQDSMAGIRAEMTNLNAANEAVFSQTAEAKAQNQLSTWFAMFLILVERAGKWVSYFEGDNYESKEEFMFQLEEKSDEFYLAATDKIAAYTYWFNRGADTPESFKAMDDEMTKQLEASKEAREKAEKEVAEKTAEPVVAPENTPPAPVPAGTPVSQPLCSFVSLTRCGHPSPGFSGHSRRT